MPAPAESPKHRDTPRSFRRRERMRTLLLWQRYIPIRLAACDSEHGGTKPQPMEAIPRPPQSGKHRDTPKGLRGRERSKHSTILSFLDLVFFEKLIMAPLQCLGRLRQQQWSRCRKHIRSGNGERRKAPRANIGAAATFVVSGTSDRTDHRRTTAFFSENRPTMRRTAAQQGLWLELSEVRLLLKASRRRVPGTNGRIRPTPPNNDSRALQKGRPELK
ncbi:hypothetical protein P154DRAFT_572763 [Amniculicola lignicola CBS 123094]|uniref:Uncharacterized protein n=1 Tax=Amniculicola lignicola CBS 123094 TaxID=1392246 RepID=A0A6A5WQX0_9PLEO|nr:hypothetical protein P154DRAFT_572763 [Amniculicola lignicola CBS 123094]